MSGTFAYTWPRSQTPSFRPSFSLPLGLWGLFINMLGLAWLYIYSAISFNYTDPEMKVGLFVFDLSWFFFFIATVPSFIVLLFRSKDLVDVFTGLDVVAEKGYQGYTVKKIALRLMMCVVGNALIIYFLVESVDYQKFYLAERILIRTYQFLGYMKTLVVIELFSAVCDKLTLAVHHVTQQAIETMAKHLVSQDQQLSIGPKTTSSEDRLFLLTSVSDLEKKIIQVSRID